MQRMKNQHKRSFWSFLWESLSHPAAPGSLTLDRIWNEAMWVLSSDSRKMSKYKRKQGLLCWICIPFWNLWHFTSEGVGLFIFSISCLSLHSLSIERGHQLAPRSSSLPVLGHCVCPASCLQSWWWDESCVSLEEGGWGVLTRSPCLPQTSCCFYEAQLPGMATSVWYPGLMYAPLSRVLQGTLAVVVLDLV